MYDVCTILLLEIHRPAEFSFHPHETHLIVIYQIIQKLFSGCVQVCLIGVGAELCRTLDLQEQDWAPHHHPSSPFITLHNAS